MCLHLQRKRSKVITSDEKEAWKCVTSGMMSEEETMEDGKISRRRPNWRSDKMTKWIDELDRRGTDLWKVERRWICPAGGAPNWIASLDG